MKFGDDNVIVYLEILPDTFSVISFICSFA